MNKYYLQARRQHVDLPSCERRNSVVSCDDRLVLCPADGGDKRGGRGGGQATRRAGTDVSLCHERPSLRCHHRALPPAGPEGTDAFCLTLDGFLM